MAAGAVVIAPRPMRAPLLLPSTGPKVPADPFTLGVASGDPDPSGVVLWTRLAPDPLAPGGGMAPEPVRIRWEVASDERFREIARRGATRAQPDAAHSVHVEVDGLEPGRDYFYRFVAGDEESPVGRTRTAPAPSANLRALQLACASCQDYEAGLFVAHRHLADEDVDVVLFLGDYIYERGASSGRPRMHEGPEPVDLDGYRRRYATYKADADLQSAHAAHPWIVTWDDHEVENNYAGGIPQGGVNGPDDEFLARRADAYRAWWEHQPVRLGPPRGSGPYRIHRRIRYGRLAEISVLDTRQYRTDQPCGTSSDVGAPCADVDAPDATMLGDEQQAWLTEGLERSRARWNVVAQQVLAASVNFVPGASAPDGIVDLDGWDGYRASQRHLVQALASARNPVVLTGDIHSAWVNDLSADVDDPAGSPIGSEIIGTSITSGFSLASAVKAGVATRPHVKYFEGTRRGYVRCTVDTREWRADHRYVSGIDDPAATIETGASFVIEAGNPGAQPA